MDIDNRGVRRGRCKVETCDCDGFERQTSSNSCGYCGDPPAKHEKLPKTQEDTDRRCNIDNEKENDRNQGKNTGADLNEIDNETKIRQDESSTVIEPSVLCEEIPCTNCPSVSQENEDSHGTSDREAISAEYMVALATPNNHMASDFTVSSSTDTAVFTNQNVTTATSVCHSKTESSSDRSEVTSVSRTEMIAMATCDHQTAVSTDASKVDTVENVQESSSRNHHDESCSKITQDSMKMVQPQSDYSGSSDEGDNTVIATTTASLNEVIGRVPQICMSDRSTVTSVENVGKFTLETGNIHIHNNTDVITEDTLQDNLRSQSESYLNIVEYEDHFYVETRAYDEAESILAEYGHVTIYGNAGDGKTAMADHLLQMYAKGKGHDGKFYETLVLDSADDYKNVNADKRQIVLVDDTFGIANLDHEKLKNWLSIFKRLDKEHSIERERTRNEGKSKIKTLLIFTSRTHIAKEAEAQTKSFKFFRKNYVVNLNGRNVCLTPEEKKKIVENFTRRRNRNIEEYILTEITEHFDALHGFPHCVDLFTDHEYLFRQGPKFFSTPLLFLKEEIEIISRENKIQYCSLILAVLNNGSFSFDDREELIGQVLQMIGLPPYTSKDEVKEGADQLLGSYFSRKDNDNYLFCHPSLLHAVTFVFANQNQTNMNVILDKCSLSFILERFRSRLYKQRKAEEVILVNKSHYNILANRLFHEMTEGNVAAVCNFQPLEDMMFLESLFSCYSECKRLEFFFNVCDNEHDVVFKSYFPVFFWAAWYGKTKFCEFILNMSTLNCRQKIIEQVLANSLIAACRLGHFDIVKMICQSSAASLKCRFKGFHPRFLQDYRDIDEMGHRDMTDSSSALFESVKFGHTERHIEILKFLVVSGANISDTDLNGNSLLHVAAERNQLSILKYLLELGLDVNVVNSQLNTPLFYAKSKKAVELLLRFEANVNALNIYDETALFHSKTKEAALSLINNGCDVNVKSVNDSYAAFALAYNGTIDKQCLVLMVKKGFHLRSTDGYGRSLIHNCMRSLGKNITLLPCLEYLIDLIGHVDSNSVDEDGCTALHSILFQSNNVSEVDLCERVQLLIPFIDVNIVNNNSLTALFETNCVLVGEELLKAGAVIDIIPNYSKLLARQQLYSDTILQFLLKLDSFNIEEFLINLIMFDPSKNYDQTSNLKRFITKTITNYKLTPNTIDKLFEVAVVTENVDVVLDIALESPHINVNVLKYVDSSMTVEKLIDKGLDVNIFMQFKSGINIEILHYLAFRGLYNATIVKKLLAKNVNFDKCYDGETVLFIIFTTLPAILRDEIKDLIFALIDAGVCVNSQNDDGISILHMVMSAGTLDLFTNKRERPLHNSVMFWNFFLDILLKYNADTLIKDKQGRLPIHYAAHPSLVLKLLEYQRNVVFDKEIDILLPCLLARNGALSFEVFKHLKHLQYNFRIRDATGATPLHYCLQHKHSEKKDVELLNQLCEEVSVNSATNAGDFVLHYLVKSELDPLEIKLRIEMLIKKGYKIRLTDIEHNSIFHYLQRKELVMYFFSNHAFFQRSINYQSPILDVAKQKLLNREILDKFIEHKQQIDSVNAKRQNLLYYLLTERPLSEVYEMLKLLLSNGLDFVVPKVINPWYIGNRLPSEQTIFSSRIFRFSIPEVKDPFVKDIDPCFSSDAIFSCHGGVSSMADYDLVCGRGHYVEKIVCLSTMTDISSLGQFTKFKSRIFSTFNVAENRSFKSFLHCFEDKSYCEAVTDADAILAQQSDSESKITFLSQHLFQLVSEFYSDIVQHQCLKYILDHGVHINVKDDKCMTPLHMAAKEYIQLLLIKNGADVKAENIEGNTPLFYAKEPKVVVLMVKAGVDVNHQNKEGKTALHLANKLNVAKCLVQKKADIYIKDRNGNIPVQITNNLEVIKYLLKEMKYDIDKNLLFELLIKLAKENALNLEVLQMSLNTMKAFDHSDNPLLHILVTSDMSNRIIIPMLDLLFKHGISANSLDHEGDAPIHKILYMAKRSSDNGESDEERRKICFEKRLSVLLQNGANIFQRGKDSLTPGEIVSDIPCGRVLLHNIISVTANKQDIEMLFLNLCSNELFSEECIDALKRLKGDMYVSNRDGNTVLHYCAIACKQVYSDLEQGRVITLTERPKQDDFDVRNDNGEIPSKLSMRKEKLNNIYKFVEILKQKHMYMYKYFDVKNAEGETPLSLACLLSSPTSFIEVLLKYGANPSHSNNSGEYLLDRLSSSTVINILLRHGAIVTETQLLNLMKKQLLTCNILDTLHLRKINFNVRNEKGESLLHHCPSFPVLKKLLKENVDVNAKDMDGCTPLHKFMEWQREDSNIKKLQHLCSVQLLLESGANPNACDNNGQCVLTYVENVQLRDLLIRACVDPKHMYKEGRPLKLQETLHYLVRYDLLSYSSLKCLHETGADLRASNILHMCMTSRRIGEMVNCVLYLLEQGVSVNDKDGEGKTPLHLLLEAHKNSKYAAVLQILLENGSDWSEKDKYGNVATPSQRQAPFVFCMYAEYFENASEHYINDKPLVWYFAERTDYLSLEMLCSSIKHHVEISKIDSVGNTLLHLYFQKCILVDALDILHAVKGKLDLGRKNMFGKTCLYFLSNRLDTYHISDEMDNSSEETIMDTCPKLSKYLGTAMELKCILSFLFENGVNINSLDKYGQHDALHYFIQNDVCKKFPGIIVLFLLNGSLKQIYIRFPELIPKYTQ